MIDFEHFEGPHPNLTPEINNAIAQSEVEGGVKLEDVEVGTVLHVRTKNTSYTIEHRVDGFYISGHATYCPEPTKAYINGSTWGGSMLKVGFIGRGMRLEFTLGNREGYITTSEIQDITEVKL